MADGFWRIKQFSPGSSSGFAVTEIPVRPRRASDPHKTYNTEPTWENNIHALAVLYQDGREEYFPWASIVHAEYQPPTPDET